METRLPVKGLFGSKFQRLATSGRHNSAMLIALRSYGGMKSQDVEKLQICEVLSKNDHLRENF